VRREDFELHLLYRGDVEEIAAALAPLAPEFVIPGCEHGVLLADALSEALGLVGNGTERSVVRRNKARLAELLQSRGLRAAPSFEVTSPEAAVAAAGVIGQWPVVVKPVDSSGSDGLSFCSDAPAVRAAAQLLLGKINFVGSLNRSVLVQRRIIGQQYYLLAVSRQGRHYISEIWLDHRQTIPGAGVVCDLSVLLPAEGAVQAELRRYACDCLDAAGIRIGPSFLEIIMTDAGPVLIDLAARMMGTQEFEVLEAALGTSQLRLTTACFAEPEGFARLTAQPYLARTQLWVVTLINRHQGRLLDDSWRGRLAALASFKSIFGAPTPGQMLWPTVDEATSYGSIFLAHDDVNQLERDYREIRSLEAHGWLFTLDVLREGESAAPATLEL
jgi:L-amino acid ligase